MSIINFRIKKSQLQQAVRYFLSLQLGRRKNRNKLRSIKPNWSNKKAVSMVGDTLVKIIVGILVLIFVVGGLYVILTKDLFGIGNMLKNIFKFG